MPYVYENAKSNFSGLQHFQETAIKTLNELFGRVNPIDNFDFRETEMTYIALGHYDQECIEEGDIESLMQAEQNARDNADDDRRKAQVEIAENTTRILNLVKNGQVLSTEDVVIATSIQITEEVANLYADHKVRLQAKINNDEEFTVEELFLAEHLGLMGDQTTTVEDEAKIDVQPDLEGIADRNKKYTLDEVLAASDAAMVLANEKGVDLKLVTGTGKNGNVTKDDVENYIKTLTAPETENANGQSDNANG